MPLLRSWLKEPHVAKFWQETEDEEKFRDKFLNQLKGRSVTGLLINIGGKPVGYIQSYEAAKVGGGWWPDAKPGVFGVDLFIGEKEFFQKGWGPKIIAHYLWDLLAKHKVTEMIIDPEPANLAAIAAYEKIGFVKKDIIDTPNGKAQLMTLNPQKFLATPLMLKRLDESWIPKLQSLFEAAPQYHLKVEGKPAGENTAREALLGGPPNFDMKDKYGFGIFLGGLLVGYIDIANGYPEKETAYLGLLLIDETFQGRGFGEKAFRLVENEVRKWNCKKIRLSVAETNDVQEFWSKMGFQPTGRVLKPHQEGIVCKVIEMEKAL